MPASVWSGYLTFGLISMPVRLFSGARGTSISFNMLHRDDLSRVKQQLICSADSRVLERRISSKDMSTAKANTSSSSRKRSRKSSPRPPKRWRSSSS